VQAAPGRLTLLLSSRLLPAGLVQYVYSIAPGVSVTLTTRPGPSMLPPDDPAILEIVTTLQEASDGYSGPGP
jgi:hypothetical protein